MKTVKQVDILENTIRRHENLHWKSFCRTEQKLLATKNIMFYKLQTHILWHRPKDEMAIDDITGANTRVIQPRIAKSKEEQKNRTKDKAEVLHQKT